MSEEAFDGWTGFAAANGVTLGALVEALGLQLVGRNAAPESETGRQIIAKARDIDRERRSRRD